MKYLPGEVRKKYEEEEAEYARYSLHTADIRAEGKAEAKIEIALNLIKMGLSASVISRATGLAEEDIHSLHFKS